VQRRLERLGKTGIKPWRVERVLFSVPFLLVHTKCRLDQSANRGSQYWPYQRYIAERGGRYRIRSVFIVLFFQVIGIPEVADGMQDGVMFPLLRFRSVKGYVLGMALVEDAPVGTPFLDASSLRTKPASRNSIQRGTDFT